MLLNLTFFKRAANGIKREAVEAMATIIHAAKKTPVPMRLINPRRRRRLNLKKLRVLIQINSKRPASIGQTVTNFLFLNREIMLNAKAAFDKNMLCQRMILILTTHFV